MKKINSLIEAKDCLTFDDTESPITEILQNLISSQKDIVFHFSDVNKTKDESCLAEYNYKQGKWIAGRFIGEAIVNINKKNYSVLIKPRFGEKLLLKMLEQIYNIKFTKSDSRQNSQQDWKHYIKRIIALIWIHKLANANLHGIPKINVKREHKGETIKGRLNVRESLRWYYDNNQVVSNYREKQFDNAVCRIVFEAYKILHTEYNLGNINIPDSAMDVINQLKSTINTRSYISENEYKNIQYKDIYQNWKPIVDLSWEIIKQKQFSLKQEKATDGFGFFIDMAEVWEQYLRTILKRYLQPLGWHYRKDEQIAYKNCFFKRKLIPDLVFQNGDKIAVWDAKYKRMLGVNDDIDRPDFFQIHTYIQNYLQQKTTVKAGGLLYPISILAPKYEQYKSNFLINENGLKVNFSIDGIELQEETDTDNITVQEREFLQRIELSLL